MQWTSGGFSFQFLMTSKKKLLEKHLKWKSWTPWYFV
jgi:hypothetical protein